MDNFDIEKPEFWFKVFAVIICFVLGFQVAQLVLSLFAWVLVLAAGVVCGCAGWLYGEEWYRWLKAKIFG